MVDHITSELGGIQGFVNLYTSLPTALRNESTGFIGFPAGKEPADIGELVERGIFLRKETASDGCFYALSGTTLSDIPRLRREGKIIF